MREDGRTKYARFSFFERRIHSMGILLSAAIGIGVGTAAYNYIRYKNGEVCFSLYNNYGEHDIPMLIKPFLPKMTSVPVIIDHGPEILHGINEAIAKNRDYEGVNLNRFHSTKIEDEDKVAYGCAIHEAHRCIRRGKKCLLYLKDDQFILSIVK